MENMVFCGAHILLISMNVSVYQWLWQQLLFTTLGGNVEKMQRSLLNIRMCYLQQISDKYATLSGVRLKIHNTYLTVRVIKPSVRKQYDYFENEKCNLHYHKRISSSALGWRSWCESHRELLSCQAEKVTASATDRSRFSHAKRDTIGVLAVVYWLRAGAKSYLIFPSEWTCSRSWF